MTPDPSVTELLRAAQDGTDAAREELLERLYDELRQMAHRELRRANRNQTLRTTALVNEAYLRLVDAKDQSFENRRHFFFVAARAMHDILVEEARRKSTRKRGGGWHRQELENLELAIDAAPEEVLALSEALEKLAAQDPRRAEVVRLRFFAGLTEEEIAAGLGVSHRTVTRDWRYVRAWLYEELCSDGGTSV